RWNGCRTVVHRWAVALGFGGVVLGTPSVLLGDEPQDDLGIGRRVGPKVGPDVAGSTVRACDVGGHAFDFGRDDAGRREGFADDGSAVCLVLGERLVGPVAGD